MKRILSLFALLLATLAVAEDDTVVISPQSIVVNPTPEFDVDVWVDKDRSGDGTPSYDIGSNIRIGVQVSEDSYVYLFNINSQGEVTQIIPNRIDQAGENNFLRAGETKTFPPEGARYNFEVHGPRGLDKVIAVASREPLDTDQLAQFEEANDFATAQFQQEEQFAETLSIVVRPLPPEDWVSDTALFYVGERPARPRYGTIAIDSSPQGARAFVDGRYVGRTPVRFGAREGEQRVRIERSGYRSFETTVNVQGGETTRVNATLSQREQRGTLLVQGNVGGARVFINGESVGRLQSGSGELRVSDLPTGEHRLRVSASDYYDVERTFTIRANETTRVNATLSRREQRGTLLVVGNVGGARVFIDGDSVGRLASGSGELRVSDLPTGEHRLRVSAPDFYDVERTFTIRSGETTRLNVSQERVEPEPEPDDDIWFAPLQLRGYPDAPIRRMSVESDELEVEFETDDDLDTVYAFFHELLRDWRQVELEYRPNRVNAEYQQGDLEVEFELNRRGASGRYRLKIELDD